MIDTLRDKLVIQQIVLSHAHSYFLARGFAPIISPKIVPFKDDERGHLISVAVPQREAEELFLSRSPQLYKEIA